MKGQWIHKEDSKVCILFFNGWGMDNNVLKGINHMGFDVYALSNYTNLTVPEDMLFHYDEIHVVAWSLGVSIANILLANTALDITSATAINGTPYPSHDEYGIPNLIFKHTLERWDDRNRAKFNLRMFGGKANLDANGSVQSQRKTEDQREELQCFDEKARFFKPTTFRWTKVLVGTADQIIPAENQLKYWEGKTSVIQTNWAHFPFSGIKNWEEILLWK